MAMRELNQLGDEIKVRMDKWIDPASNKKYLNTDQSGEIELMIKEYSHFSQQKNSIQTYIELFGNETRPHTSTETIADRARMTKATLASS